MTLNFDEDDVARLLDYAALIPAMERALAAFSAGQVTQPPRMVIPVERHAGFFLSMPALAEDAMGIKIVNVYPENAARDLPTHLATVLLYRPETGEHLATFSGGLITEMRTAAVSAAATRALARPDAEVLAVLGSGVQAEAHVHALRHVGNYREIRLWSRNQAKAERLAEKVGGRAMSAEQAVRDADVVVTATASDEPILMGEWLKPGAHVNAVGWHGQDSRELDDRAMENIVIVDSREAAQDGCGDVRLSGATVDAELGEVIAGTVRIDRASTTIFESVGLSIEDIAAAKLIYDRHQAAG
ncbi:ornithine cyclodeaminase family protein [Oceanibacterium hippocampi]|uniref:L-lysine cyclodeaminase n=1 Tax=Oceanibacterium hippocampi TaxID=745714 RepID=A0A1Y5TPF2_9PROT|nr:ornithine cyclodeaminase family protein [Oceanibacterium hippocampi]SLN68822.1 L-lysine cyclodeaminase [Oceanibacterium hippocampi]